jgi:hypothetical protein
MDMNRKIGICASWINACAVAAFAASMLVDSYYLSCLSSIFIALSFVPMAAAYSGFAPEERRVAGRAAVSFAAMYAIINASVYFIQLTAVVGAQLPDEIANLIDYRKFGMMFALDMLGYGLMAVSTFFTGLSFRAADRADKWLKGLLLAHGMFAVACIALPLLGTFRADMPGGDLMGVLILEFWCAWFLPVGILSARHFKKIP